MSVEYVFLPLEDSRVIYSRSIITTITKRTIYEGQKIEITGKPTSDGYIEIRFNGYTDMCKIEDLGI